MGPAGPGGPASPLAPASPVSPLAPGWPSAPCGRAEWGELEGDVGGSASPRRGRIRPPEQGGARPSHLRGGQQIQQDREGRARRGHPRRDGENGVTPSRGRPPVATEGWSPMAGPLARVGGTLTGAPRAPVGPAGPGGPASPWKRGGKPKRKGCQGCDEEVAVGTRTHRSPERCPAGGWPYLVTGSTSGAGGADGASQTSETVFARSAVSTFGTRVALGEADDGGLPGDVTCGRVTPPPPPFPSPFRTAALGQHWVCTLPRRGCDHPHPPPPRLRGGGKSGAQLPAGSKGTVPKGWGRRWH